MTKKTLIAAGIVLTLFSCGIAASLLGFRSWVFAKYPAGNWVPDHLVFTDASFVASDGVTDEFYEAVDQFVEVLL